MNEKLIKFTLPSFDQGEPPTQASSKARIVVAEDDPVSRTDIVSRLQGRPAWEIVEAIEREFFGVRTALTNLKGRSEDAT